MAAAVKTLIISGYYGFKNSGDEAVLLSILLALKEQGEKLKLRIEPIVLSADPEWTERTYGVRAVHRMRPGAILSALRGSSGLISGGGSLLQDATGKLTIPYYLGIIKLAQWLGKPTFIYSQGIGPVNRKSLYPFIRRTFAKCRYVSVRDRESAELLIRMGCRREPEVVPDPVMGLRLREPERRQANGLSGPAKIEARDAQAVLGPAAHAPVGAGVLSAAGSKGAGSVPSIERQVVGVSVRFWNGNRSELTHLARCLDAICSRRGVEIRFLPFHLPADEEASAFVIGQMQPENRKHAVTLQGVTHPQDMLAEVSRCDVLIGMRLHSLIYAASQYVPMIGISYDPKIDQFLGRLGMYAAASVERFDEAAVIDGTLELLDGREEWLDQRRERIDRLKAEAQKPAQHIAAYLR